VETYGMTEAAHQMASSPLPPGQRKKGSVGVAAGPEVGIMDQGGHLLPPGVSGEVVIRGPNVTSGYLDNPEANVDSYTDSWFRTGDQGYLDDGGFLFLTGRLKEIINRGGEKIAPREIDEALLSHPAVDQAAAFAVSHPYLGETVAAAVVLRWGSAATERELREFAASRIASFKVPEKVLFVEEIPKGPTGKIQRIGLAAKLGVDQIAEARAERPAYAAPGTRVEKEIASIFAATLGVRRVGLADNFFDLGGDSLLVAMLLTEIQQSTGVAIPLLTFVEEPSVAGVCRNLRAPRLQQASGSSDAQLRVIIRGGQSRPPLVCVPGSYGNVVGFFRLAQHLGADQPVTAFRLPAVARNGVYSIEHLAARYVAELLEVHPEGPYHLLGSCTGGFVACEMARQILAQGKTVGLLALMDCYNHAWGGGLPRIEKLGYRAGLLEKRFIYHHRNLRSAGLSRAARYLRPRWAAFRQTTRERCEEWAHDLILRWGFQLPAALEDPRLAIRHAAAHYVPPDYPGRLELFQVAEPRVDAYDYPDMGWQGKARGGIGMHQIPGSHATMLSEPNVRVIAAELLGCLDREWCVR
jgi:oxalate---CoA ligase